MNKHLSKPLVIMAPASIFSLNLAGTATRPLISKLWLYSPSIIMKPSLSPDWRLIHRFIHFSPLLCTIIPPLPTLKNRPRGGLRRFYLLFEAKVINRLTFAGSPLSILCLCSPGTSRSGCLRGDAQVLAFAKSTRFAFIGSSPQVGLLFFLEIEKRFEGRRELKRPLAEMVLGVLDNNP